MTSESRGSPVGEPGKRSRTAYQAAQRVDIAHVVESFLEDQEGVTPDDMLEGITRAPRPRKAPRAEPIEPMADEEAPPPPPEESWYVVIDEIVEATVTYEAWPWPSIDPATRFLSFDLSRTNRKTVDLNALQRIVDRRRGERDASRASDRPLRIGDVFEVAAEDIREPGTWTVVIDDTRRKRREAQAALYAMAAPPLFRTSEELEAIAQESEATDAHRRSAADNAFPAV